MVYHDKVSLERRAIADAGLGNVGVSLAAFHHLMGQQQQRLPASMLTTATHDHKRGEDVRARINALSEMPQEWRRRVRRSRVRAVCRRRRRPG